MNALCVTVSIPLLLLLAGFNHAHGLTTFGKSQTQGTQQSQKPTAHPRICITQENCTLIKGTTCINNLCLCGNNENPVNGKCLSVKQGSNHLCEKDDDCVDDAHCITSPSNKSKILIRANDKICVCDEGFSETQTGTCGGKSNFYFLPALLVITASSLFRTLC